MGGKVSPELVVRGYSRDTNGKWIAVGSVAGVTSFPPATPPELTLEDVPRLLNKLEARLRKK